MTDMPEFQRIKASRTGRTAELTLASDKVNALDREVVNEVIAFVVDLCERDPEIGALVVTGEGSLFSAGVNVKAIWNMTSPIPRSSWAHWARRSYAYSDARSQPWPPSTDRPSPAGACWPAPATSDLWPKRPGWA